MITLVPTPDGPFGLLLSGRHVLASGWTEEPGVLRALVHPGLLAAAEPPSREAADAAREAVEAYYAGDHDAPLRVPVRQVSGPFLEAAWAALRRVPGGSRVSYTELAALAERPAAVRAAAAACARNAAALLVPCHRVVRADGGLGGFRYGTSLKERLLAREAPAG